jgi:starch-binding outer membrane protein SusE/F
LFVKIKNLVLPLGQIYNNYFFLQTIKRLKMKLRLLFSTILCAFIGSMSAQSIGIIGDATPTGWGSDTDMTQDSVGASTWTIVINLIGGKAAKFRQDNDWAINWGATDYPFGTAILGSSDNVGVPYSGLYTVKFNTVTGAYSFLVASDIGIIGTATPGGWDYDTNLAADTTGENYEMTLNLLQGKAKFRQDDAWTIAWGGAFPSAVDTFHTGGDITIPAAGKYKINFNKVTGAYKFTEIIAFSKIGLIGTATVGGWDADSLTQLTKNGGNPDLWEGVFNLVAGKAKFRANGNWTLSWGGDLFPEGVASTGGADIVVTPGEYKVSFNTKTLAYKFVPIIDYATMSMRGSAVPAGGTIDINMDKDPVDKSIWRKRLILNSGDLRFRANNSWATYWANTTFPTGTGLVGDLSDIPVTAGEYKVTFNSTTGEYNFELLVIYATVGLVGTGTPLNSWDTDVDMTKDAVNEYFWSIPSIALTDGKKVKFRAEDAWDKNWGGPTFFSGIGTQGGPDIVVVGGTYKVTLNADSGEYAFGAPTATFDILKSNAIALSPNPTSDFVNIEISEVSLRGDATITIFNNLGAAVMTQNLNIQDKAQINVAGLSAGNYIVNITNGKFIVGKKLVITK